VGEQKLAKWDLSKLPEGRKPLPDEWFREKAQMQERIKELEAKLAWAVGELEEMLMLQNSEAAYGILRVYTKALVAELKGESDE
jgi:hypothetical protein